MGKWRGLWFASEYVIDLVYEMISAGKEQYSVEPEIYQNGLVIKMGKAEASSYKLDRDAYFRI